MRSTVAHTTAAVLITAAVHAPTTVVDTTQTRTVVVTRGKRTHTIRTDITRIRTPATATDSTNLSAFGSAGRFVSTHFRTLADRRMALRLTTDAVICSPTHIYHADWGTDPKKRWLARAKLGSDGRYTPEAPHPVGDHTQLITSIRTEIGSEDCALVGFDFPIGVPERYASAAGIGEFKSFLLGLGTGAWADFFNCARLSAEISVHRPFYPFRPGGTKQAHVLTALGLQEIDDLRRQCERKQNGRRAACALFWTLGANQVGKGAIVGWRDVLAPALRADKNVALWPFDGRLNELFQPGRIVIAETYPAECYGWFFSEPLRGKGKLEVRKGVGIHSLSWAINRGVELAGALRREIEAGFPEGDDAFDAVVGLFGMIEVVTGRRQAGDLSENRIRKLEGWILGQSVRRI